MLVCLICVQIFGTDSALPLDTEIGLRQGFDVMPWEVGQFVEYQILTPEGEGEGNLYKVSLVGEETYRGEKYYWMQIDIYEMVQLRKPEFTKNITLKMLVPPVTSDDFKKNPAEFIASGFSPKRAVKLKIQIFDNAFVDVAPDDFFSHQEIVESTPYLISPEAMGMVDFSKLQHCTAKEQVSVPAGDFYCEHLFVLTDPQQEYWDEGFDLWRSPKVPLLGVVKMEFSKTLYWEKWLYKNKMDMMKSFKDFLQFLYTKRVPGRRRPDTHWINLVRYGKK